MAENNNIDYLRAMVEKFGKVSDPFMDKSPMCTLNVPDEMRQDVHDILAKVTNIPHDNLTFFDTNCIDFLGILYNHCTPSITSSAKYDAYRRWLSNDIFAKLPVVQVLKASPDAVMPAKTKESDAGYDLTVIRPVKKLTNNVTLYDTGIKIRVSHGYYTEVVPRSSISKTGYMLANNVGIIDRNYNGNIFIALAKIDPTMPDLEMPCRCAQLLIRKQIHADFEEITSLTATTRGEGGFGSTSSN
jgi:deoxyuridine 5'-triphosphate nucleotidohydrolase